MMEMVYIQEQIKYYMKVNGKMIKKMVQEKNNYQMDLYLQVHFNKIKEMVMENYLIIKNNLYLKVNGKMVKQKKKEYQYGKMVEDLKVNG